MHDTFSRRRRSAFLFRLWSQRASLDVFDWSPSEIASRRVFGPINLAFERNIFCAKGVEKIEKIPQGKESTNMRPISKVLIATIAALVFFALPAISGAARVYYIVGVRHVYRIGTDKYFHATERKQIEEDYADEVAADNAHYQYQISHGANSNAESAQLQSALHDLAVERDTRLGALYPQCDWVRRDHPSFNIKVDGPYQVIGVDYHEQGAVQVWDDYTCYAPWPGYTCVGPNPYGWNYGVVYTPGAFVSVYNGWYGGWVGFGSPAFVGFYGIGGPMVVAGLSVNVGLGFGMGIGFGGFFYNPGLGGFYHRGPGYFANDPFRGGYIAGRGDPRAAMAARAGFAAGAAAVRSARAAGYADGIRAGARSSFAAGTRPGAGSFARNAATSRPGAGYAHSAVGATSRARTRSFARTAGSRPSVIRSGSAGRSVTSRAATARRAAPSRTRTGGGGFLANVRTRSSGGGRGFPSAVRSSGGGRTDGGGARNTGGGNNRRHGCKFLISRSRFVIMKRDLAGDDSDCCYFLSKPQGSR